MCSACVVCILSRFPHSRRCVLAVREQRSSGLVGLAAVALVVGLVAVSQRAARVDELDGIDWGVETSKIENALQKIEGKLGASFSSPPARVVRDARKAINQLQSGSKLVGDGAAAEPLHRMPGEEWTGQDQHHYDTNMAEAVGEDGTTAYDGMKLPPSFMPISGTLHYLVSFAPD